MLHLLTNVSAGDLDGVMWAYTHQWIRIHRKITTSKEVPDMMGVSQVDACKKRRRRQEGGTPVPTQGSTTVHSPIICVLCALYVRSFEPRDCLACLWATKQKTRLECRTTRPIKHRPNQEEFNPPLVIPSKRSAIWPYRSVLTSHSLPTIRRRSRLGLDWESLSIISHLHHPHSAILDSSLRPPLPHPPLAKPIHQPDRYCQRLPSGLRRREDGMMSWKMTRPWRGLPHPRIDQYESWELRS